MPEWISVKDRMPDFLFEHDNFDTNNRQSKKLLLCQKINGENHIDMGWYEEEMPNKFKFISVHGWYLENVSHWMPLPSPPGEKK